MARKKVDLLKNIDVRELEEKEVFRVRLYHKGKSYTATKDTLSEAVAWRDDTKVRLKAGIPLDGETPSGDIELGKATDDFIKGQQGKAESTINGYVWTQNQLLNYFGENTLLSHITQSKMYEYISHRQNKDRVGVSKIRQELSFVKMLYETAQAWDIDLENPARNIKRPQHAKVSREEEIEKVIKEEELKPFLEKILHGHPHKYIKEETYHKKFGDRNKKLYAYLVFLLYTGMRPSEAMFLRWGKPSVKYIKEARLKKWHAGYVDFTRGGFSNVGTKTVSRFVPAHPVVKKIIEKMIKEGEFIFVPDETGQSRRKYRYYRSAFETARANTVLESGESLRQNIDFYSFRHTARSRMAVCGLQDSAAETIIGHEGDKMQRTYTHYDDADLIKEIAKLDYQTLRNHPR